MAIFDNLPFFAQKCQKKCFSSTFSHFSSFFSAKIQRNTENLLIFRISSKKLQRNYISIAPT